MRIELEYINPVTGKVFHHIFNECELGVAIDFLTDAINCNYGISIWRLIHAEE